LIRHAQAGTRENYDLLSELGREQARLLGEDLAQRGIVFAAIHTGTMVRQRTTAEIACAAMTSSGLPVPEIVNDPRLNEFSLAAVYRAITQRMIEESEEFARDFEEMQQALIVDPHATRGATGRCDAAIIRAWMQNKYPEYEGESWASFYARVTSCAVELTNNGLLGPVTGSGQQAEKSIAIFTSATPIAITAGEALGLRDEKLMNILGVLYNSGVTILRPRSEHQLRLFTLNSVSHLPANLCTFR
jgi:broad specificity phosphatase PhoE